jgi:Rrf2 family transcriptional regulator, cysteine metabolism repressor
VKLSVRSDYGARAVIDLARRYGEGPVQSAEIAARQGLPEAYLEQLLTVLRRAGLIRSIRGPAGGHLLARAPDEVRLGEIVGVLDGPTPTLSCLDDRGCRVSRACALADVWHDVHDAAQAIVDAISLADLLERQHANEQRTMYHI